MIKNTVICFGEMLWDILPGKALPGGAVMNVAYHLHKLGNPVALISRVGNDERGRQLINLLSGYGLPVDQIQIDNEHQTGIVYADMSDPHAVKYDIVHPVAWDFIEYPSSLETDNKYLVFGSLSTRDQVSRTTLKRLLAHVGTRVLDINLRAPHYTQEYIEWLLQHCDILKLNDDELSLIQSWYGVADSAEEGLKYLANRFSIPLIVLTRGADGAMLLQEKQLYKVDGVSVKVADTIGSGDAFLAGFLHAHRLKKAPIECLQIANSLGALVATYSGGCPDYDISVLPL
ncbi:carbohydrate kinase [Chitinophaga silvatica]|uniref:Carbohydrate kinase n=1 Tax=Chitinophaga silvatica TaxID=2282649 RepID=A0A3E1Y4L8_9BACT|nr:carbohydrate kinase [Chitinophaga silvatica]RFS19621.1 carbohydrate kinase [Chitinophaga silvatica]